MNTKNEVKEVFEELVKKELTVVKDIELPTIFYDENKVSVVDLFSGSGGLSLGLEFSGIETGLNTELNLYNENVYKRFRKNNVFQTVYALDIFEEALQTYSMNFPDTVVHKANIRKLKNFPKADLITFGFPCPGFSAAGPRKLDDERNYLYVHCCRALEEVQPKIFIAENVPGILTLKKGEVFAEIIQDFENTGYNVFYKKVDARSYGAPQIRERVIIVGVRKDLDYKYEFPEVTHGDEKGLLPYVTLNDVIKDLEYNPGPFYTGSYSNQYMSRNRKKNWDEQSFTIQASGRHAPIHPSGFPMIKVGKERWEFAYGEDFERRLSAKEVARIQTFPDWFKFSSGKDNISHNTRIDKVYKQIGNAVPVLLAKAIAKPIAEFLYKEKTAEKNSNERKVASAISGDAC